MKKQLLLSFLLFLSLSMAAKEARIASPNGKLVVTVSDNDGYATYSVTLNGQLVVMPSRLGFKADFGDFSQGLAITKEQAGTCSGDYRMWQVKQSNISFNANTLTVGFENGKNQQMEVDFIVEDNDLAFRYLIPRPKADNPKCAVITEEVTSFCLPDGTTTFLCPQIDPMKGWERTKPSYEEGYRADAPMNVRSAYGQGYTFPCLFGLPPTSSPKGNSTEHGGWVLISETGVAGYYCGSHLSDYAQYSTGYTIAYPQQGENNGFGSTGAQIGLPGATPWRTITVGETLKPIVETTIVYDVVLPLYEPSEEYKGGRYTWSWLIWQDNSINYDDQVKFIDLAAAMGYELCLVDNWWDERIGRDRISQLSAYAQKKGVSLMLWYNSNGAWNDAPQTPRNIMHNSIARDREMAWLQRIGVKGIKVDFFAGDKQETMRLYEDILYDANRYGIQCIFHGCTIPRGWERMYPNYVASEAVLASENVFFSEHAAIQEPFELTLHPFCRNAVGTMDWGGVIMNRYLSPDNKSRHSRKTTDVFEIATAFTNQTAVQCIAIQPNNLLPHTGGVDGGLPQHELDFLKTIPATWDETRFIDGYPGKYVVLARRHAGQWYIAALNAQQEPLNLTLNISEYNVKNLLVDVTDKKGVVTGSAVLPLKTDKKGIIKLVIQPCGGAVLY
ncbi:MAG: glycoside hydrolase family 97 catalytic domain-containing protein [Bacteroidaceae bacterium]|nr:glycoside hydrolase family 97 catalytic domain-containing protein [Bacteroidaceae bacterium]